MAVYHILVQSFPIVLWYTAAFFILVRLLSDSGLAQKLGSAVRPLILLGILGGAAAYVLGLLAWPLSATTMSPLGRNHLLMASWTLAYWCVVWLFAYRRGDGVWDGATGWLYVLMAGFGAVLVTITGALGGSAAGNPSAVSDVLRAFGWEVYTTFYAPNLILGLVLVVAVILAGLAFARRRTQ